MADETAGTRGDLHESVSREHRRVDDLFAEFQASFAELRDDPDAVRDTFAALSEQLDVHFQQEDLLYYASVRTLRPELESQVRALSDAHGGFRREIVAIGEQLARGDLSAARERISAFAEGFRRHEAMEESLLQQVEAAP